MPQMFRRARRPVATSRQQRCVLRLHTIVIAAGWGAAACLSLAVAGCDASPDAPAPAASAARPRAVVPAPRSDLHSRQRRLRFRERARRGGAEVALVGDSITEAWSYAGRPVFDRVFEKRQAVNLGINGDRTEHVLGRLEADLDGFRPRVVVLMIGTNNLGHDPVDHIVAGVGEIVGELHRLRPDAEVVLVAVTPRGATVDAPSRVAVRALNAALAPAAESWDVTWVDAGPALLEPDGVLSPALAPDALHFSTQGYERWWSVLGPVVERALSAPPS